MSATLARAARWCFRSRETGKITVGQTPNAPLWVWVAVTVVRLAWRPSGVADTVLSAISMVSLAVWAVMEMGWGVNPFRRTVGAAVFVVGVALPAIALSRGH